MTWEPRPLPDPHPETEPFWRGASEGRLLLRECESCGLVYHYPRDVCPDCLSEHTTWRESDGRGRVYSYSVVRQLEGWPADALPLLLAYVELDEGPRLLTNLVDCARTDVDIGTPVEVTFEETGKPDVAIPVFTPVA